VNILVRTPDRDGEGYLDLTDRCGSVTPRVKSPMARGVGVVAELSNDEAVFGDPGTHWVVRGTGETRRELEGHVVRRVGRGCLTGRQAAQRCGNCGERAAQRPSSSQRNLENEWERRKGGKSFHAIDLVGLLFHLTSKS